MWSSIYNHLRNRLLSDKPIQRSTKKRIIIISERHDLDNYVDSVELVLRGELEKKMTVVLGLELSNNIQKLQSLYSLFDKKGFLKDDMAVDCLDVIIKHYNALKEKYLHLIFCFIKADGTFESNIIFDSGQRLQLTEVIEEYLIHKADLRMLGVCQRLKQEYGQQLQINYMQYHVRQDILRQLSQNEDNSSLRYRSLVMAATGFDILEQGDLLVISAGATHGYYLYTVLSEYISLYSRLIDIMHIDCSGLASEKSKMMIKSYWDRMMDELNKDLKSINHICHSSFSGNYKFPDMYTDLMQDREGFYKKREPLTKDRQEVILNALRCIGDSNNVQKNQLLQVAFLPLDMHYSLEKCWKGKVKCNSIAHLNQPDIECQAYKRDGPPAVMQRNPRMGL